MSMNGIFSKDKIRQARKDAEIKAVNAARLFGITPEHLSAVENGKALPSQNLISKMSVLYRQPIAYFLSEENKFAKS